MSESLFERTVFLEKVQQAFKPLEALLPEGDAFNYDEAVLFSGVVNGSQEHVVVVPLTKTSPSFLTAKRLGEDVSWNDVSALSLFGFYMMPPTDCIHTLQPDVPYLVRGIAWDRAEVVDAEGKLSRYFVTWWHRGEPKPAWYKFSGNVILHIETCGTASSNQK